MQRVRAVAAGEPEETGAAWLARQLELAIRNKLTVTVTVRLPDGHEADYLLEPAALAGGRLRARDRRADIERTLPLSSITPSLPHLSRIRGRAAVRRSSGPMHCKRAEVPAARLGRYD